MLFLPHRAIAFVARRRSLLALALLWTLLDAPKPLTVDDGAYYYFARQMAHDPLHPYGFTIFWYQHPEPAIGVLAPPVVPAWWALGLVLLGDRPWLWKLWMFPFALLFVLALAALLRRFARGMEQPLTWMTVLSPLFLPSLNLMLDVPAMALELAALELFFRACGRRRLLGAALAGLLAGLAMQTKYTAVVAPVLMVLYTLLFRRWAIGLVAVGLAGGVFVAWEAFVHMQHHQSHFIANLAQYPDQETAWQYKLAVLKGLLPMLGGLAPAVALLGMAALGCGKRLLLGAGIVLALGYVAVACDWPDLHSEASWLERPLEQVIFGIFGLFVIAAVICAAWELCIPLDLSVASSKRTWFGLPIPSFLVSCSPGLLMSWFLVLWLLVEVAGYFALTPFPAGRRVMGLIVVSTLLIGRLAAETYHLAFRRHMVQSAVVSSALLGLLFYGVDLVDAFTQKDAAETAARSIATSLPKGTVWYAGHWGFQFYAERAGMTPVVPDLSTLRPGDWLVVPDDRWEQQVIEIDPQRARAVRGVRIDYPLPLRTVRCFYGGFAPLEHHSGPRIQVTIYRITAPWVPRTADR